METTTETLIIGAGPAGLQLGYFLAKAGRDYVILERDRPGAFFLAQPRHRTLLSINKVYTGYRDPEINLRWDWNSLLGDDGEPRFSDYSEAYFPTADDLVRYLADFAARHALRIETGVEVQHVRRDGDAFVVSDSRGHIYRASRLVVATGVPVPNVPAIPGIEHAEQYGEVSVDAAEFKNQRVLVLGKGNSAFETASHLVSTASVIHVASPNTMRMAWDTKYVGHLRAVNNNLIDTYQLKSQNVILDAICERIERRDGRLFATFQYLHADGERETLVYDRIICCTGFRFDTRIFDDSCRPATIYDGRFPAQTSAFESTTVPGLYFAGTLMQARDFKKKQSGFIHGFRYNIRALHRMFELRYHGGEWPHALVPATPEAIAAAVLARVNRSSGLWQQTGFLCDVIVLPRDGGPIRYYEELPVAYVHDSPFDRYADYFTVTLEFGDEIIARSANPLAIDRVRKDDVSRAHLSAALHPIVRRFSGGAQVDEHHVIEDIEGRWVEDEHVVPLERYFAAQLAARAVREVASSAAVAPPAAAEHRAGVVP